MKFFNVILPYNYTWDQVAIGLWQRYPNPQSKHVLSEDVVLRKIDGHKLLTKRLITKKYKVPKWGRDGPKWYVTSIIEESIVDPVKKTITTYTRNIDLRWFINVVEKCVYTVDPENKGQVLQDKSFWNSSKVFGLSRAIESFGYKKAKKDAKQTQEGFIHILERLFPEETVNPEPVAVTAGAEKMKERARKASDMAKEATDKARKASEIAKEASDKAKKKIFHTNQS